MFHFMDKETETQIGYRTSQEGVGQRSPSLTHTPSFLPPPRPPPLFSLRGGKKIHGAATGDVHLTPGSPVSGGIGARSLSTPECSFYICDMKELDKTSS